MLGNAPPGSVQVPYNASTDVCTMSNRTDPDDPDGESLDRDSGPREGKCARRFGANGNDGEHTENNPRINYRLFAQAALTATTALPFVVSNMAINAFNRCDNQTDGWEGYWDCPPGQTGPCAPWPGPRCGSVTIGAAMEEYVLDGSVNEGSLVVQPAVNPVLRMGLIVNAINRHSPVDTTGAQRASLTTDGML